MADPRVVVVGSVLYRRHLATSVAAGIRIARGPHSPPTVAGSGAGAAWGALQTRAETHVEVTVVGRIGDDVPGRHCAAGLRQLGAHLRLATVGRTPEHLVLDSGVGVPEHLLDLDVDGSCADVEETASVVGELDACRPGDVLILDAPAAVRHPDLLALAYDRDLQIVLDLHPALSEAFVRDMRLVDVAVVDAAGAMAVVDAAEPPSSLAVYAGSMGAWWDHLSHESTGIAKPCEPGHADVAHPAVGADIDAAHRFAGALAAGLAAGMDRPEVFDLAVRVAGSPPATIGG